MLGEHIRNLRKTRNITLKDLALKTGLSIGYLSQIERNLTDPSLSTLRKISSVLDIPTYLFMDEEPGGSLTTKAGDVITLSQPNSHIRYHLMSPMPSDSFVPQSLVIRYDLDPLSADGEFPVSHPSEEIILVETGSIDVIIGAETIRLSPGDSTLIRSNLPHTVINPCESTARGMAIFTPAIWFPKARGGKKQEVTGK